MRQEEKLRCRRCGRCCQQAFIRYVEEEDLARWQREKRQGLLDVVQGEAAGSQAGRPPAACRFLSLESEGRFACSIYETRPRICQGFQPGQAKICSQHPIHQIEPARG